MKRFLAISLAALMLLALGCASSTPARETNEVGDLFDQLAETEEQAKERIYSSVRNKLMTDAEKQEMTADERAENAALEAAMRNALQSGTREELEQRIAEWTAFADDLRDVFSAYRKCDLTPFSDAELSLLSKDELNEYYAYQRKIDEAFAARKEKDLNLLNSQWQSFQSESRRNMEAAKEEMLNDWVSSADLGSAITGLFSLGTIKTATTVSGHRITATTQYTTDFGVTDDQIKNGMDSYLSWASSMLQNAVNSLGFYIGDLVIRIEYINVNGKLICDKEFKVIKATQPAGFNPPDKYYPDRDEIRSGESDGGSAADPGSAPEVRATAEPGETNAPAVSAADPTAAPTAKPTETPTAKPTETPTAAPTETPNIVSVPAIENGLLLAQEIEPKETQAPDATILSWSGEFKKKDQTDKHTFTAERDGVYSFFFTNIPEGQEYGIQVSNEAGKEINNQYWSYKYSLGEGVDLELSGGQTYTVAVRQNGEDYGTYTINVGVQKAYTEIGDYTAIYDSIEFVKQQNGYLFVPPVSGEYRFGVSGLPEGYECGIQVVNASGKAISNQYWSYTYGDREGQTVTLTAGHNYLIKVRENGYFGSYCFEAAMYKQVGDISEAFAVDDSIQFLNQRNMYTFTPKHTASYQFGISGIPEGYEYLIQVWNAAGNAISNQYWSYSYSNKKSQSVNLTAGQTYTVIVRPHETLYGTYRLDIGTFREPIEIKEDERVKDTMQYRLQKNLYAFAPDSDGKYQIELSGMPNGYEYRIQVWNPAGDTISNQYLSYSYKNGESQAVSLVGGQTYLIVIWQNEDFLGDYIATIHQ